MHCVTSFNLSQCEIYFQSEIFVLTFMQQVFASFATFSPLYNVKAEGSAYSPKFVSLRHKIK